MSALSQLHFYLDQQYELYDCIAVAVQLLKSAAQVNRQRIQARLDSLKENWYKFKENHDLLGAGKSAQKSDVRAKLEEDCYFKDKMYRACEQNYLDAVEQMTSMMEEFPLNSTATGIALADQSLIRSTNIPSNVRLPRLEIPTFSGEYAEWVAFKDMFTSVIGANTSLTLVEKLQYLKTHLNGKAADRLKNVTLTAANFQTAWDDLVAYYDNKRILVDSALHALFTAKQVTHESAAELETLYSEINQALGALDGLNRNIEKWDDVIVYVISRKLDSASIKEWERSLGSSTDPPTWDELKTFLITRIRSLQAYERATPDVSVSNKPTSHKNQQNKVKSHHVSAASSPPNCAHCQGDHYLASCPGYQSMTTEQRNDLVRKLKLCINCLGPHRYNKCFSKKRCQSCGGKHHTSIHLQILPTNQSTAASSGQSVPSSVASTNVASIQRAPKLSKILTTALVKIVTKSGDSFIIRALLDQGSEVNLASENLIQLLRLPRNRSSLSIVGIGADSSSSRSTKGHVSLKLQSRVTEFTCSFDAYILPKLTNNLPSASVVDKNWSHLEGLELADPGFCQPGRIDLILGVEIYSQILQNGLRKGSKTSPIAQQTSLGWIISGSASSSPSQTSTEALTLHCHLDYDNELNELVKKFMMQEEVFNSPKDQLTPEEMQCEAHYKATHTRINGQYMVKLPFKTKPTNLGNSRTPALKMLERTERRFARDPAYYAEYSKVIKEYEEMGHMKRTSSPPQSPDSSFYLPHHGVKRECSSTTKLRVVFNGSMKTNQGTSLNEALHEGPKLQVDLPDVLTRWRKNQFAFSSDVVKMFRQILMHPDDWDYQRILWFEETKLIEFQMTTVTFGTTPAPYLANRTLRQLSEDEGHLFPAAKEVIEEGTYVDDVYDGASTIEEGKEKIRQIIGLFKAGGFPLQKWTANHEELLERVSKPDRAEASATLAIEDGPIHRTLGLNWQPKLDRFVFIPVNDEEPNAYTKRVVLSRTAKLFDPLGWLAPVVIRAKLFMQELWQANLGWDEPIPTHLETRWKSYINQLQDLSRISVPRWLGLSPTALSVELHGFADASQAAIGAVAYLRVIRDSKPAQITILSSKSKVTPIKRTSNSSKRSRTIRITTPRLELSAALLLTKVVDHIRQVLRLDSVSIHLWTDSSTTLYWIKADPSRWKDFVRNRVSQIQEILPEAQWHHLPGEDNPADLASRGVSPRHLSESSLWWHGPSWLTLSSEHWPQLTINQNPEADVDLEERHKIIAVAQEAKQPVMWDLIHRYSSLTRLIRITAWCKRAATFKQHATNEESRRDVTLQPEELEEAKTHWIKETQRAYFSTEINLLSRLESIPSSSSVYRLTPVIDAQGILRVGGRLHNAQIDPEMKHPIILPRDSPLTTLILDQTHRLTLHGGVQLMLTTLRRNYWIIGGRQPVRRFIHRCVICARYRASTSKQLMGQLPTTRTIANRPFYHSGVDYAGPFTLKTWKGRAAKTYKGYLVVFVCFSSSAVHLELATDYSTEGFLSAYKRFTSRRGICSTLSSDCGTNFIGADAELRRLFNAASKETQQIIDILANDGTKWIFNPPASPHFGGKWEAAVKSTKFHIKRVLGDTVLTYEDFNTLLVQIEAVLNSRPICPLSEDPNDLEALTPGHFIIGEAIQTVPEPSLAHLSVSRLSRYQLIRRLIEKFWERWSIEYIQRLQEVVKWHNPTENIKEGALVLVVDERYPPSKWPLARVVATHPGTDGLTRVVTVKTQTTTLKRPIVKLCLLPILTEPKEETTSAKPHT